jgi:heptosyltransferase-2
VSSHHQKRILILRYRFIGDTILTVPFLRNLRRAEPEAYIAWMVAPGSAGVVQGIPYVDELLFWDPVTIHADSRGGHRTLGQKTGFIREIREKRFDTVYVLKRSFSSALIAYLSGARKRVGFATEGRGFLLTTRVPYRHDHHEVQNFLEVLRADGVPVIDDYLESWLTPDEVRRGDEILAAAGVSPDEPLAIIHPYASFPPRGWHFDDYAALSHLLAGNGFRVIVLGGDRDRSDWERSSPHFAPTTVSLVGTGSLRETMAVLRRGTVFIGNDSGIMHLAAAAGVPLVALFGPQSPVRFGPWGRMTRVIYKQFPCSPCRQKFFEECSPSLREKPACIEAITVDEVFAAAMALLKEQESR